MYVGKFGRAVAALAVVGVLASACTPASSIPTPPPPSPPVSQTPTETAVERQQRLDYEAAEKAYRTFRAEVTRVAIAGGSLRATAAMQATAGGPYLAEYTRVLRSYKKGGFREEGAEKIVFIKRGGYSSDSLTLNICEDSRSVLIYDPNDKVFGRGERRTAEVEVKAVGRDWKVWQGDGKKVDQCS